MSTAEERSSEAKASVTTSSAPLVDDHARSEILPDETSVTTAGFLARALDAFATARITVGRT